MNRAIADIRVHAIAVPLERSFWMSLEPYTAAAELVVEVETEDGTIGIGQIHGRPQGDIAGIINERFRPLLLGQDPMEHTRLWEAMFRTTFSRDWATLAAADGQPHFGGGGRAQMMAAVAGIDIALWDIKGRLLEQPVHRLLGGLRQTVPCYASGGYYGPQGEAWTDELVAEMAGYWELGYPSVKMKVGGLSIEEDVKRVAAVREALPEVGLMLDANAAWDVPTAIDAARAFEPYNIAWLEEPVAWFDSVHGLNRVAGATSIPIASGEHEQHRFGCRDLIDHVPLRYMQFDCTRAGGITEWLRVAGYAEAHGVLMAPHHDPQVHGHLLAAVSNGYIQEVFPNQVRDPLWDELYLERQQVVDGQLVMNEEPGLGFTLNYETLDRYRVGEVIGS